MTKPLLIGNWKMNGSLQLNQELLHRLIPKLQQLQKHIDIAVCPPSPYLFQVCDALACTGILPGAQTVSEHASGAHTGEVSASMLSELKCRYVLVGHSERRLKYAESSTAVAAKFEAVQNAGMMPVLCVGETLEEREAGQTRQVIEQQLQAVIDRVGLAGFEQGVVAYEPVWAIGTGEVAQASQIESVHQAIRTFLYSCAPSRREDPSQRLRIIYGGSVNSSNAAEIFNLAEVNGGLIGGASLKADEFIQISESLAETVDALVSE